MVTGSMAANFYATPRMTRDIDLVVELSETDIDCVVSLFQDEYSTISIKPWCSRPSGTGLCST